MVHIHFSHFFSLLLSFSLLVAPLPLSAIMEPSLQDSEESYIYCGQELSNIIPIISQLSDLDENDNSPLHALHEHITKGFNLVEYDAFMETLEYAEMFLEDKYTQLDPAQVKKINDALDTIFEQVIDEELVVNASNKKDFQDKIDKKVISLASSPVALQLFDQEGMGSDVMTRLVAKAPALVVSISNQALSGLSTIDGVALSVNDRVLLVNQSNPIENGLWEAQVGSWTRPADFATGSVADQAYVLILAGLVNAGSSWLCTTPAAVIDTDPITFVLFALPDTTLAANVGSGTGLIFRDRTGTILNIKSLIAGNDVLISNNADDITINTNATSTNTANTIVARDASGNFSAGAVSVNDQIISGSLTVMPFATAGIIRNNASGVLSSSLLANADIAAGAAIVDTKLATINTAGKVSNSATTANASNLGNAIVSRDFSGNFSASTITANLNGNATSATNATTAITATNFTGSLAGDITGGQGATTVNLVGGQTAANVAAGSALANSATSTNTASSIIRRNAAGGFSASAISVADEVISNSLTITPLNTAGVVHNNASGLLSSSLIVNADIDSAAAIADTKLATISTVGKVANSATTATGLNTANAIVARDAAGNFSAGIIIANLNGSATNNLLKAGDTMTGTLQLPAGTATAPSLIFTGSTTAGISAGTGNLVFSTNALERFKISSGGTLSIKTFTVPGVLHNDSSGNISSSLITNSDVATGAAIIDSKLATITTAGKVSNSATTATEINTSNSIVKRDSSGNFTASRIRVIDLTASGNLILSTNPSTATAGNIFKDINTPFIHNFGTSNMFVGEYAGNFSMTGNGQNTVVGAFAFGSNSTGESNTGLGYISFPDCVSGTNNVAIGVGAAGSLTTGSGNIYINANAASGAESNTTRVGTSQTQCYIQGIFNASLTGAANVRVSSSGQLGVATSSAKFKHNIQDMNNQSDAVFKLRPVTFVYNNDVTESIQFGLIAEEVNEILPELIVPDKKGSPYTVQYEVLPVLLLNEMKKQQAAIEAQDNKIEEQAITIENLIITVEKMNEAITNLQSHLEKFAQ